MFKLTEEQQGVYELIHAYALGKAAENADI